MFYAMLSDMSSNGYEGSLRMATTWVLLADQSQVRVFEGVPWTEHFKKVHHFSNDHVHQKNQDMVSDKAGRVFDSFSTTRHGAEDANSPKANELKRFVSKVCDDLLNKKGQNAFDRLIIVSEPKVMGLLRDGMNEQIKKKIVCEYTADLSRIEDKDVAGKIKNHVRLESK